MVLNGGALLAGAGVWKLYVANLQEGKKTKEAEVELVARDRDIWKEKVHDLEKRSPELMEQLLSKRIEIRDQEIERLGEDRQKNEQELEAAQLERASLRADLDRTKGFRKVLELEGMGPSDHEFLDELLGPEGDVEVIELGEVGVDSGMLMVTDPCYIDSEWMSEPWALGDRLEDTSSGKVYVHGEDFERFDVELADYGKSANELIAEGVLVQRPVTAPLNYSYNGAAAARLGKGYGELNYRKGHRGAGVVFSTAFGDGGYMVYGELRNGRLVRIYLNLM